MNAARKVAVFLLLTAFLAGCRHKNVQTAPPQAAQAPEIPVSTLSKNTPPPQLPPPEAPKVSPPVSSPPPPKPKEHKPHHKKVVIDDGPNQPAQTAQSQGQKNPNLVEQASNGDPEGGSPIGQFSAAGEKSNTSLQHQIADEINSMEKGLNDIKRPLSEEEQTTATQIRTFLAKAKDALVQDDLDGATTLVTKAKVLLNELMKT